MRYEIFTDGSCRNNGKENSVGGWAFAFIKDNQVEYEHCGYYRNSTNQRMELYAMLMACKYITYNIKLEPFDDVILYTDSAYIANCVKDKWYESWRTNGWINSKKQPVANKDLWEMLLPYFDDPSFIICKTVGHSKIDSYQSNWNNYVDNLAQSISASVLREGNE